MDIIFFLGKWWGPRSVQPILALHGWQDNAGTFDRLCPLLITKETSILCIDLPGHGRSSHYPTGMQYYLFWDGIALVRRIVKHFHWEHITLLGHSLGGALSFMYAAAFPDDVVKFISIDIAGPPIRSHKKNAGATGDAIDKFLKYETLPISKTPCYKYDDMVDVVVDAYTGSIDREAAKILMRRGMGTLKTNKDPANSKQDDVYHFSRDLRLKVSLLGMLSLEQVLCYASQIKSKVLNIRGVPGMKFEDESVYVQVIDTMRTNSKLVVFKEIEGTHHLHLTTPERVAPTISEFLNN